MMYAQNGHPPNSTDDQVPTTQKKLMLKLWPFRLGYWVEIPNPSTFPSPKYCYLGWVCQPHFVWDCSLIWIIRCNECVVVMTGPTKIYATFVMRVVAEEDQSRAIWFVYVRVYCITLLSIVGRRAQREDGVQASISWHLSQMVVLCCVFMYVWSLFYFYLRQFFEHSWRCRY